MSVHIKFVCASSLDEYFTTEANFLLLLQTSADSTRIIVSNKRQKMTVLLDC